MYVPDATPRRPRFRALLVLLVLACLGLAHRFSCGISSPVDDLWPGVPSASPGTQDPSRPIWEYMQARNNPSGHKQRPSWGALKAQGAHAHLGDTLRDDKRYLFTEVGWGFSNQVVELMNLIYLGKLSGRIPILFAFNVVSAFHTGDEITHRIPVSSVFDLSTLAGILDEPLVEAHEVKRVGGLAEWQHSIVHDGEYRQVNKTTGRKLQVGASIRPETPKDDHLGCFSFTMTARRDAAWIHTMEGVHGHPLALPSSVCPEGNCECPSLHTLAEVLDQDPSLMVQGHQEMGYDTPSVLPDPQIGCIDLIFHFMVYPTRFRGITEELEAGLGAWAAVGRHMRFQPGLIDLANQYLRHHFRLASSERIPPYLSVHIRRGDMVQYRPDWLAKPAQEWLYAAWKLLDAVMKHRGIAIRHVVLATDERDPTWITPFLDAGWTYLNHTATRTARRLGSEWFPMLLDNVILAGGQGFLGMPDSTMGAFAYRRVVDWQSGIGRFAQAYEEVPEGWSWEWREAESWMSK